MRDVLELLRKVRRVEIAANRTVNELFAGQYRSVFRGRGIEFNEVREYAPGDDIRSIDWNVTARTGGPYIKRYVEERELTVLFLVDTSGSGIFGSDRSKVDAAVELAATLMYSAMKNNDKVGLLTFGDRVERYFPPRKGRANVLRLLRELLASEPRSATTNLLAGLEYLNRVQRRRAVVFILSDFFVPEIADPRERDWEFGTDRLDADLPLPGEWDSLFLYGRLHGAGSRKVPLTPILKSLLVASRRHDVVALMLRDRRETVFPNVGLLTLRDPETGETVLLDTSRAAAREQAALRFERLRESVVESGRRAQIDLLQIDTAGDYVNDLRVFFERRARKN